MKKFFRTAAFAAVALLSLGVTGCSDDDDNPAPETKTPKVELTADETKLTDTSVGFVVTATDATAAAWVILPATEAAPTGTEIFKNGTAVKVDGPQAAEAVNLDPATAYTVYAAATQGEVLSKVASLNVTTLEQGKTMPVVTLTAGKTLTATSADFEITTTNATAAAWVILPAADAAPTAEEIIKSGTAVAVDGPKTVLASDLTPETAYTVYAAAANDGTVSKVAELDITTLKDEKPLIEILKAEKNNYTYRVNAAEGETYYRLNIPRKMYNNFISMCKNDEERNNTVRTMMQIYGTTGTGPQEYEVVDNAEAKQPQDHALAGLDYLILIWKTENEQTVGDYVEKPFETPAPDRITAKILIGENRIDYDEASFSINLEPGIASYFTQSFPKDMFDQLKAEGGIEAVEEWMFVSSPRNTEPGPSVWWNLESLADYVLAAVGIDEKGDRTELFEYPFTVPEASGYNVEFDTFVSGDYYGAIDADNTAYVYSFMLSDCELAMDSQGVPFPADGGPGNFIALEVLSATPAGETMRIPDGEYLMSEGQEAGTWFPYDIYAYAYDETNEITEIYFTDGMIGIEDYGDSYFVTVELITEDGEEYSGIFEGDITLKDSSHGGGYAPKSKSMRKVWSGRR